MQKNKQQQEQQNKQINEIQASEEHREVFIFCCQKSGRPKDQVQNLNFRSANEQGVEKTLTHLGSFSCCYHRIPTKAT